MATPLHDQLGLVQSAALTTVAARVAVEQATSTQNIFAALEASNALLTQVLTLLALLVNTAEP